MGILRNNLQNTSNVISKDSGFVKLETFKNLQISPRRTHLDMSMAQSTKMNDLESSVPLKKYKGMHTTAYLLNSVGIDSSPKNLKMIRMQFRARPKFKKRE